MTRKTRTGKYSKSSQGLHLPKRNGPRGVATSEEIEDSDSSSWFPAFRTIYRAAKKSAKESPASKNSLLLMLLVNLFTIGLAITEQWSLQDVVLVFWLQNIAIGVFTCLKFLFWKNIDYRGEDRTSSHSPKAEKRIKVAKFIVLFFGAHILLLTIGMHADLLEIVMAFSGTDLWTTFLAVRFAFALFVVNHAVSFILNYGSDTATPTTYKQICENAFIRILPLHFWPVFLMMIFVPGFMILFIAYFLGVDEGLLSTISSAFPAVTVILFMVLKAIFEIPAHLISHSKTRLART